MEASNAAAMHEALEFIKLASDDYEKYGNTKAGALDVIYEKACAALTAPARNCDRFGDELDAQLAFLNEVWLIDVDRKTILVRDKFENWTCYMRSCYATWLMAPAVKKQNQKGE